MPDYFTEIDVLRNGDSAGNGMTLRLTDGYGRTIHTVAVPQEGHSHTGPTWAYIFENEGLTLIDPGAEASFDLLRTGMALGGLEVRDIDRVIITHGHADHDGGVARVIERSDAELWALDIYQPLLPFDPRTCRWRPIRRSRKRCGPPREPTGSPIPIPKSANATWLPAARTTSGTPSPTASSRASLPTCTPRGHSPDEICAVIGDGAGSDIVFTGDHVLPEISPHPTMKTDYTGEVRRNLPVHYQDPDDSYGLLTYLRSLQRVADLGTEVAILPAHRLYNKHHKFNFQTAQRAADLIRFPLP